MKLTEVVPALSRRLHGSSVTSVQSQLESAALGSAESSVLSPESELFDLQEKAREISGFSLDIVVCLEETFPKREALPNGWTKPDEWLYDQIGKGRLPEATMSLPTTTILIEDVQKPEVVASYYGNPRRSYTQHIAALRERGVSIRDSQKEEARALGFIEDPLAKYLTAWRETGDIESIAGVPRGSRFGLSAGEIERLVLPQVARMLNIRSDRVRLPKAAEFMYVGNKQHPEWGKTTSSEWFDDRFGDSSRLVGGGRHGIFSSNPDSLGDIDCAMSNTRSSSRGFRLAILPLNP
jgi:hypothetical protein